LNRTVDDITSLALRRAPFSFDMPQIPQGSGSGFVWEAPGHVVTASRSRIDRSGEAKVVGAAPDKDVAAIRIGRPARSSFRWRPATRADSPSAGAARRRQSVRARLGDRIAACPSSPVDDL